ncbi:MAG: bile acid:sodium symporter family protein [Phycisphaerales bacterium]|nr:MAG: bile acid:sodium symporter family protein [Phycisphaerales bacterium]
MRTESSFLRYFKFIFGICLTAVVVMLLTGHRAWAGPPLIAMFGSLALYFMSHRILKSFAFTVWVFAFVSASMVYPVAFMSWFGFNLGILIVPLIQVIMFGMGTTLCLADFGRVFKMPWPVFVGFVLQFSVMPLTGLALAKAFGFDAEVAAGVVLIGSCPGGVASNLMTYLAGGNVALSVTMTSCSTLVSPLMTPFLMDKLAGQFIEINFLAMMFGIINMIIVPIVAGLIANRILYGRHKAFSLGGVLAFVGAACVLLAAGIGFLAPSAVLTYGDASLSKDGFIVGLLLIGVVAIAKLVISVWLKGPENWMNKALPIVSMAGICFIIAIITARSAEKLIAVGPYLIAAAIIHNFVGYILGYWLARAGRLDESSCRTVAFEVGMQNGGMASGLAMNVLKSAPAALAPAIFGPWMNVSGSVLATWWHRKPVRKNQQDAETGSKGDTR